VKNYDRRWTSQKSPLPHDGTRHEVLLAAASAIRKRMVSIVITALGYGTQRPMIFYIIYCIYIYIYNVIKQRENTCHR